MKKYTAEEKAEARKSLPKPLAGFIGSQILTALYFGIKDKLKLNWSQVVDMCEVANVTLLGLEPEHALETNLHQYMPELSNADMRELVADLNDRVFKEAQRRLRENVIEPGPEDIKPEGYEKSEVPETAVGIRNEQSKTEPEEVKTLMVPAPLLMPAEVAPVGLSISMQRLAGPTVGKTEKKDVSPQATGIQQISVPPPPTPIAPVITAAPVLAVPPPVIPPSPAVPPVPAVASPGVTPQAPRIYKGTDPYREAIE